jgi:hypothetical protein
VLRNAPRHSLRSCPRRELIGSAAAERYPLGRLPNLFHTQRFSTVRTSKAVDTRQSHFSLTFLFALAPVRRPAPRAGTGRAVLSWYAGGATCAGPPAFPNPWSTTTGMFVLRQPACTNFEKPFLYLLIGKSRALLLDILSGRLSAWPRLVDSLLGAWRAAHGGALASWLWPQPRAQRPHLL